MVSEYEHQCVVDKLEDENGHGPIGEVIRNVLCVPESSHEIKDLLDAPVSECNPEGQQEVDVALRDVNDEPLLTVSVPVFEQYF